MMSLISCPTCNAEISINADGCPHCGEVKEVIAVSGLSPKAQELYIRVVCFLVVVVVGFYFGSSQTTGARLLTGPTFVEPAVYEIDFGKFRFNMIAAMIAFTPIYFFMKWLGLYDWAKPSSDTDTND